MKYICFNGHFLPGDQPLFTANNRPFRFGDGVFETMKIWNNNIRLEPYHWQRLFSSLEILKIHPPPAFTADTLRSTILQLCQMNECTEHSRVRLSVYRGIDNQELQYLIECWPLDNSFSELNDTGYNIDIFPGGIKCADAFSSIKTNNFISYVMAIDYANDRNLDDCLLLNQFGRIADSTIASVFIIKGNRLSTPSMDEGCTNGVMRRHLVHCLQANGYSIRETGITISDLEEADEIFLSNAIRSIRWVKQFRNREYTNAITREIYSRFVQTFF